MLRSAFTGTIDVLAILCHCQKVQPVREVVKLLATDLLQAVILNDFKDWPSAAITVEFWMWSTDRCRRGVPVSYATGGYEKADNSFLILNYNDWWACHASWMPLFSGLEGSSDGAWGLVSGGEGLKSSQQLVRCTRGEHPCPPAYK